MKDIDQLILAIPKMEVVDFIGLARLLKVQLVNEDDTPREFADVLQDVLSNFKTTNRQRRREIIQVVKKANACHSFNT